jgi:4'-phosphopantetheinyl transferase EntD
VKRILLPQAQALLPPRVHFDEVWVEAGAMAELSPLFPEEIPLVERAVEKRQREFRAGRHVARSALTMAGGPAPALLRGVHGQPGFPAGYHGSITHTGRVHTYAAAVATQEPCLLGIDAELSDELMPELIGRIASPPEIEHAARFAEHPGLLVFAAKEAVYKCVYPLCERVLGFGEVRLARAGVSRLEFEVLALEGTPLVEVRWLRDQDLTLCLAVFPRQPD